MTLIYLDFITTLFFFLFVGYLERFGILRRNSEPSVQIQKINELFYRNVWLYVLPYFYGITLISDLENFFTIKAFANQIFYFFLILLIQLLIFLRLQPLSVWVYVLSLKENLQKFHFKFFKRNIHANKVVDDSAIDFPRIEANVKVGLNELRFLLNAVCFPFLFIITNAFVFTKLIFLISSFFTIKT
jgi:hypothetical protein